MAMTGHHSLATRKKMSIAATKHGEASNPRKGKQPSREYRAWQAMKTRCLWKKFKQRKDYSGRGISICAKWLHSFPTFLSDMGRCPKGLTLERINNDGNYEPNNCKWGTRHEQSKNQRHGWRKRKRNKKGQFA